jgi:hypothetical protein
MGTFDLAGACILSLGSVVKKPKKKLPNKSIFARINNSNPITISIWAAGATLVFGAVVFYFIGFVKQNIMGEAFFDFQYPYLHPFSESWKIFFFDRIQSRLFHGVLVSALYYLFGFNPPAYYLTGLVLVIGTAVLITLVLRPYIKSQWMAALLVVTFTWLPLNVPDLMALKKLHHALAWFAFWLAVYFWQKWTVGRRLVFLSAATLSFLATILSYEIGVALLPVAVFISLPRLKSATEFIGNFGMAVWITLLSGLAFLNLEGLKEFSRLESVNAIGGLDPGGFLQNTISLLPRLPGAIWNSGLMENIGGIQFWVSKVILALALVIVITVVWQLTRMGKSGPQTIHLPLVLAGLWLTVVTFFPFILAGQGPDGDSMRGAAFGVVFIILAGSSWLASVGKGVFANIIFLSICLFWTVSGLIAYADGIASSRQEDLLLQNVTITLKEQVPDVSEGTDFIFVNSGLGRTGCIGFVNMLYDRFRLHCFHLISGDVQESYIRTKDGLVEDDGRLWPNRFIIVTFDGQGMVTILDQLDQDDFDNLPITWEANAPLVTNRSLIYPATTSLGRNFDFYNYMKEQYFSH